MESLETLSKKLIDGKNVTLQYKRYNDGTGEDPDIIINRVSANIKTDQSGNKDIVVYLSKEDDNSVHYTYEIYKMPVITDLNILKYILKEVRKQSHL